MKPNNCVSSWLSHCSQAQARQDKLQALMEACRINPDVDPTTSARRSSSSWRRTADLPGKSIAAIARKLKAGAPGRATQQVPHPPRGTGRTAGST